MIIMTNLKQHTFLKHAGCPREEGGYQIRTMTDKGEKGGGALVVVKNLTFCRTSFVNGPLVSDLSWQSIDISVLNSKVQFQPWSGIFFSLPELKVTNIIHKHQDI